ncbi:MAG: hypothetical protein COA99_17970 [Moraxellaceae bacterium]|nr:MAG: hypothetical protein COA99_17970 [Moraxellaceae bacterium]
MTIRTLTLLTFFVSLTAHAWEVDDFTHRAEIIAISADQKVDNLFELNEQTNKYFHAAVSEFNSSHSCVDDMQKNSPEIYSQVKSMLGRENTESTLEDWISHSRMMVSSKGDQEMYGTPWSIDPSFNLNAHVVGVTKIGHFVDEGFDLFKEAFIKEGGDFYSALQRSNDYEDYVFGLSNSGVKSYADMAASYSGLTFYMSLLHGEGNYLSCNQSSGEYEIQRDFDWADYVNDSWDSGINCSMFYRAKFPYDRIANRQQDEYIKADDYEPIAFGDDYFTNAGTHFNKWLKAKGMSCPAQLQQCKSLASLECATYIVSPACLKLSDTVNKACANKKLGEVIVPSANSAYRYGENQYFIRSKMFDVLK